MEQVRLNLTLRESNALKGIALMMLLIHHLFYIDNGMWDDMTIGHYKLAHCLGVACKACVALFVFLSGYALGTTTAGKPVNVNKFYLRRFSKLYFNLWIIALFFVPLGVFIFDRNFQEVYADPIWMNAILDFLGLINITGQFGYNPTWWFYSCILLLYLIFPLVATCIYKWPKSRWIFLLCSILLVMVPWVWVQPIRWYAFPFILGIVSSKSLITNILPPPQEKFSAMEICGSQWHRNNRNNCSLHLGCNGSGCAFCSSICASVGFSDCSTNSLAL